MPTSESAPQIQTSNALNAASAANNEDGRLEAVWNDNGTIMHAYQLAPNSGWSSAVPLTNALPSPVVGDPLIQLDELGALTVVVDANDGTYATSQVAPNSYWHDWQLIAAGLHRPALMRQLGPIVCPVVRAARAAPVFPAPGECSSLPGPLDVYYGNAQSGLMMHQQQGLPGTWEPPVPAISDPFPGQGPYQVVAFNAGAGYSANRIIAYATATNAAVCFWPPYVAEPGCAPVGAPPGGFAGGASLTAGVNLDGRGEVYALAGDHGVWHVYQLIDGTWTGWEPMFRPFAGGTLVGSPQVQRNVSGTLELFMATDDGTVWHEFQGVPNGSWNGWWSVGSTGSAGSTTVALAVNADGRLEEFNVKAGPGAKVTHAYQLAPATGPWSPVIPL